MMTAVPDFLQFWGKARRKTLAPGDEPGAEQGEDEIGWHPLAYHSLDVAAVAQGLLPLFPNLVRRLAGAGDSQAAGRFIVALALLHDIGKFARGFQFKVPALFPATLRRPGQDAPPGDHTFTGLWMLNKGPLAPLLKALAPGIDEHAMPVILHAVGGHHGRPVDVGGLEFVHADHIGRAALTAAEAFAREALPLAGAFMLEGELDDVEASALSWQLAGFINLADWIGSDQHHFTFIPPIHSLAAYWQDFAVPRARQALAAAGLGRKRLNEATGFHALTGLDFPPAAMQALMETIELPERGEACFTMIEDITGGGKTESALILAHRLMLAGAADGIYVALPTMATANAMYQRLGAVYRRLFHRLEQPSLALSHGAAHLHEGFGGSVLPMEAAAPAYEDDDAAEAVCAQWIASDRRRAFFADAGAGTVDQAFLAVLPAKFAALRQLGLSRKMLIIDEVHSYDAYEGVELARLVEFQAANGGSVIALSATLPEVIRTRLVTAWRLGCGMRGKLAPSPASPLPHYPLCSMVTASGAARTSDVAARADLCRSVAVRRLEDPAAAYAAIAKAAEQGAAVAWVRNTVDDALEACRSLQAMGLAAEVFHARFAMADRQAREARAMALFGRGSTPEQRRGRVLVAMQVIEQSLDLDFDLLVSDIAPIDMLIQRAGRLWRHARPTRPLQQRQMLVVSPLPVEEAGPQWLSGSLPGTSYVYANHALIWKSARVLFKTGEIRSPEGVRHLVEQVYSEGALDDSPKGLEGRRRVAEGESQADTSLGRFNVLDRKKGYGASSSLWHAEVRIPTRLGPERTIFRLARWTGETLEPWAGNLAPDQTRQDVERLWALSEVSLASGRANARGAYPPEIEQAALHMESTWADWERAVLLPVLPAKDQPEARLLLKTPKGQEIEARYDCETGLTFPQTGLPATP
ncbi:CRISPR-associated helicase Cas3' [Rhizobium paknamense]|nr:CRISPR-associated helicase Cas3' [Rhizobium paknamense]